MQNATSRWAKCISLDAIIAGLAYLWLVEGYQGAANVLGFWLWFEVVVMLLCTLLLGDIRTQRPRGLMAYNIVANGIIIAGAAYMGHFMLAGFLAASYGIFLSASTSKPKGAQS